MMSALVRRLKRAKASLQADLAAVRLGMAAPDLKKYKRHPVAYARLVLGVRLTKQQRRILRAVLRPPYRILVPSGHDVGKTFLCAVLVCWWFDTRDPSVVLTTAPKLEQVRDLLWKEIRYLRNRAGLGGFPGPKSLRLETNEKHFAKGVTAASDAGFQGQHEQAVLVVIDEAEGVDGFYFDRAKTMATGPGHAIIAIYNPYSSSSHVAQEESAVDAAGKPSWLMLPMSSLEHPNVRAELDGREPPFPQAVRVAKVDQWVQDWCTPLTNDSDRKATDVLWRGKLYRPGPRFEAGALGRRPTQAVDSLWSVALVDACIARQLPARGRVQIGCDVARFGDDNTAIHVRVGGASVHHEAVNGWSTVAIAERLKRLACQWGACFGLDGKRVPIAVDDCGVGGGVTDILAADGWNVFGVNVSMTAPDEDKYDCLRSALWCDLAEEGERGNVDFSRLTKDVQQQLRRELPSQQYKLDARGRRCCLPKERIKALLGRSPDNADSVNLAYCAVGCLRERVSGRVEVVQ